MDLCALLLYECRVHERALYETHNPSSPLHRVCRACRVCRTVEEKKRATFELSLPSIQPSYINTLNTPTRTHCVRAWLDSRSRYGSCMSALCIAAYCACSELPANLEHSHAVILSSDIHKYTPYSYYRIICPDSRAGARSQEIRSSSSF